VRIASIEGCDRELPFEPERNTAGRALIALRAALSLPFGFELTIHKGIPFGSGLGGSAASATAAVVAANALLSEPLSLEALYPFALAGESVASGSPHGDNVAAQLLGGLVLIAPGLPLRLLRIAVPASIHCAVVRPDLAVETRAARAVLAAPFAISEFVAQAERLAGFIAACHRGDLDLLRRSLADVLVEPRRAGFIPGFPAVKQAALAQGALGCSISGAGPSVFAWFDGRDAAEHGAKAMHAAFAAAGLAAQAWVSPLDAPGARVLKTAA
jgi:homoserine kinase